MLFQIDGIEYHAHFRHLERTTNKGPAYETECAIHEGKCRRLKRDGEKIAPPCLTQAVVGVAKCHPRLDTFVRSVGRALALDRALRSQHPATGRDIYPRGLRTAIWDAYKASKAKLPPRRG